MLWEVVEEYLWRSEESEDLAWLSTRLNSFVFLDGNQTEQCFRYFGNGCVLSSEECLRWWEREIKREECQRSSCSEEDLWCKSSWLQHNPWLLESTKWNKYLQGFDEEEIRRRESEILRRKTNRSIVSGIQCERCWGLGWSFHGNESSRFWGNKIFCRETL